MDERRTLRLEADGDTRARQAGRRRADEAEVDGAADADKASDEPFLFDAGEDLSKHLGDRHAVQGGPDLLSERRRQPHDDLVRAEALPRRARLDKMDAPLRPRLLGSEIRS